MNVTRFLQLAPLALALGAVGVRVHADPPPFPPSGPLIKISELSTGSFADPNAQYLVLRMAAGTKNGTPASNGNNVGGYIVVFYQPDFHETSRITLPNDANRGTLGAPYLIANAAAQKLYHVRADFIYEAQAWGTQGYICLYKPNTALDPNSVRDPNVLKDDCLAYGQVSDSNTYISNPLYPNVPLNFFGGVPRGYVARRVALAGSQSSDRDFVLIDPNEAWPSNNRGVVGSPNSTPCGSGNIDANKQCDDGSMKNGVMVPGCSSDCRIVSDPNLRTCGNGLVDAGEACDDGGTVNHDGCSGTCQWESPLHQVAPHCGNAVLENGESCDATLLPSTTCASDCTPRMPPPEPGCGDGTVQPKEQCDGEQDCDAGNCVWSPGHASACGNGAVEPGEECDDGNVGNGDGCSDTCRAELPFVCPNGLVEPGEYCDPGTSGQPADTNCTATCAWTAPVVDSPGGSSTTGTTTVGPGVNTTAGGGSTGRGPTTTTTTGGSGTGTGGGGSSSTGGAAGGGSSGGADTGTTDTGGTGNGNTIIKSASCAQGGTPALAWALSVAALFWARRKRTACTLP